MDSITLIGPELTYLHKVVDIITRANIDQVHTLASTLQNALKY